MVATYSIAGKQVGSHVLAIATLATVFVGSWAAMGGSAKKESTPPIKASSSEEENFIKDFIKQAEAEGNSKAKH